MNETINPPAAPALISFNEMFEAGGPVMYILLALSVIALAIVLLKFYQFEVISLDRKKNLYEAIRLWQANDNARAIRAIADSKNPIAIACHGAMAGLNRPAGDTEALREEVARVGKGQMNALNRGVWGLELIATISPLLGLLGTVLGMIEAFKALQVAGNQVNPAILSGGIWQALMTTAAGLAVAIPVLLIFKWLERRINAVGEEMEDAVTRVFTRSLRAAPKTADKSGPAGGALPASAAAGATGA